MFEEAYQKAEYTPIPANKKNRKIAQREATYELRGFVNQFLRYLAVTDSDRIAMGIHNRDAVRTPSPVSSSVPEIETDSSGIRILSIRMRKHGAKSWAKPSPQHESKMGHSGKPPQPCRRLPHTASAIANHITLRLEEAERGRRVFFAGRWVNSKKEAGHRAI